jgi:hypothetical protein
MSAKDGILLPSYRIGSCPERSSARWTCPAIAAFGCVGCFVILRESKALLEPGLHRAPRRRISSVFDRGCCLIVAAVGNRHLDFFTAAAATPIADVLLSVEVRDFEEK